jgi:Protein of unknown function (DUF3467)
VSKSQLTATSPTVVRAPDHRYLYANHVRLSLSPYDITLDVGHVIALSSGETTVEESLTLVMSPVEAKAVALMLSRVVEQYEANVGAIPAVERLVGPQAGTTKTAAKAVTKSTFGVAAKKAN